MMGNLAEPVWKFCYPNLTVIASHLFVSDAAKAMIENRVESVIVFENDSVVGIITLRDMILDVVAKGLDSSKTRIKQVIKKIFFTIQKDEPVSNALKIMKEKDISRLIVMDGQRPLGVIRRRKMGGNMDVREVFLPELEDPSVFICPYCKNNFENLEGFQSHMETHFNLKQG